MAYSTFFSPRYLALLLIGMANSLPLPFMGSLLSIWLAEKGFDKSTIGLLSLSSLPFTIKILWTPLIDYVPFPFAEHSSRKGWMVFALVGMASSFLWLSHLTSAFSCSELALCLATLSLFSGCFYVTGIVYEIESLHREQYSMGSASVITGYRLGLLLAGAGALYLASQWDWTISFLAAAFLLFAIAIVILIQPEPFQSKEILQQKRTLFHSYPTYFHAFWQETILQPLKGLFNKTPWIQLLVIIVSFKLGDNLLRSMVGPFYLSMGFSKSELASAAKVCGLTATICGAFLTAHVIKNRDPLMALGVIGILHACSLSCFYILALYGGLPLLYITVVIENFTGGMAITGFITFCWKVCERRYAMVQYALLWSLFSFKSDLLAVLGSFLAEQYEWKDFFLIVTGLGIISALVILSVLLHSRKKTAISLSPS